MPEYDDDDAILRSLGYKQVLYRGLDGSSKSKYHYGLSTGGPSALIWTWIAAFTMTMFVACSLAEICSSFPSAGSVYHWTGQLVPASWAPVASYVCGWTNFLGNFAGDASFAFAWGAFLNAALISSDTPAGFTGFSTKELVGISIGILFLWSILICLRIDRIGWVSNLGSMVQGSSIIIIVIIILVRASTLQSASFVFTKYYNGTGFTDRSYVVAISLLTALFSFSGYEASLHLTDETGASKRTAPYGVVYTCLASGFGGLVLLLALLFCTDDIEAIIGLTSEPGPQNATYVFSGNAAVEVFRRAGGASHGAGLAWLLVINCFFAGISVAVTAGIAFALARDDGLPFSATLSTVHPYLKSPVSCILLIWLLDSCLLLLPLGSSTAFYSFTDITTIGFQVSYAIPIFMKVIFHNHRFKDEVSVPEAAFSLGMWSKPIGVVASVWLFGTSCVFFLPTLYPVTLENMNWAVVVVGGVFVIGMGHWLLLARLHFRGHRRRVDEMKVQLEGVPGRRL